MTAEKLHDALNLLPGDLIAETDRLRTVPKKTVIRWQQWISMAACAVLILSVGLVLRDHLPGMYDKTEAAAQAPAAAIPENQKITADAAAPEAPAEDGLSVEIPAEEALPEKKSGVGSASADKNEPEEELCIDHSHSFAEETDRTVHSPNYCGNMVTTISVNGEEFAISGSESVAITDILINLDYDPEQICRCMTDITVDTEMLADIQVNLTEGFARCEKGQAALTEAQVRTIQEILNRLR